MRLLLVDGTNAVMRRATVAKELTPEEVGRDTARRIRMAVLDQRATHCLVAFDSDSSVRAIEEPGYKATRTLDTGPYKLAGAEACLELGLHPFAFTGYEADDVIATLTVKALGRGEVTTLSADNDLLYLAQYPDVTCVQYAPKGAEHWLRVLTAPEIERRLGVPPALIPDMNALIGGKNDAPGVPKVGAKTALKLLTTYGAVENMRDQLGEHYESVVRWKRLLTPVTTLEIAGLRPGVLRV